MSHRDTFQNIQRLGAINCQTPETEEWNQKGAITLILIIAVIGMTSITVFYLLKTKQIIE
mgnify:FL=1